MNRILAVLPIMILLEVHAGPKGEFWETKEYKQWSADECKRILEDSPWAQRVIYARRFSRTQMPIESGEITFIIRLFSALPMRQAVVRMNQITANYADLTPEQKMAFDQRAEEFLSFWDYGDKIVVSVKYSTDLKWLESELKRYWQNFQLKRDVAICGNKGKKAQLIAYTADAENREFRFVFPRKHEDRFVITPEDQELILEFPVENFTIHAQPENQIIRFKLNRMSINGALAY